MSPREVSAPSRRAIRVFVSSTFRDMQAERDELVKRTFPELRRRCEERGVGWAEVDLRWGVTDEEKAEGAVLPICLAEIEHSRPYFIGLLGDRYGWVPDEIPSDLAAQEGWLADLAGRSVTELEILHGVLNDPDMAGHAFFYLRDPAWAAALPPAEAATYLEGASPDEIEAVGPEAAEAAAAHRRAQLAELKDRIRASGFPVHDDYPDPRAIGDLVLADLGALIDQLFPADAPADPLVAERAAHDAYAEARFGLHVGGAADRAAIDAHLASGAGPLLLTGPPGTGKSALLATWARDHDPGDGAVITHFVGASVAAADPSALVARLAGELAAAAGLPFDPAALPTDPDDRRVAFADLARQAGAVRPIIVIVDGLDQLEDRDHAPDLAWLPYDLPPGITVLASAVGGRPLEAARARSWAEHEVAPLGAAQRRELIDAHLARFAKRLGPELTERLVAHPSTANPLFLRTILEELRQHGDHFTLGEVIDRHLAAPDLPALFDLVLGRWEADFDDDRPGLVRDALTLLWAARHGLAEPELTELLGAPDAPLPHARWSPIHLAAGESLVDRSGLVGFLHEPLRQAVDARWLGDGATRAAAHRRLADYFGSRPHGPRVVAELPWQLQQAGAWPELAAALARPDLLTDAYRTDLGTVRAAWAAIEAHGGPSMPDAYASVLAAPAEPDVEWAVARLLTDAGHAAPALALHRRLVERARADGDRPRLAGALANLAAAHLVRDELDDAEAALAEQEALARELGDDAILQVALGNQGALLRARGRHDEALARMADEEALCRRLGDLAGIQASLSNQGAVRRDRRDIDGALAAFTEQERVARQLGDPALIARALANQALVLGDRGDIEGALALLARQEEVCRTTGDRAGLAAALGNRAGTLFQVGRLDEAEVAAVEEGDLAARISVDSLRAHSLFLRASIAHRRGDRAAAIALLDEHRPIVERLGDRAALALALGERGTLAREAGDLDGARAIHAEEQALYEALGDDSGLATSLGNQALVAYAQGRPLDGIPLLDQAEAIIRRLDVPSMLQVNLGNRAALLLAAGQAEPARAALAEQEEICRRIGDRAGLAASVGNLGVLLMQTGDPAGAEAALAEQEQLCREIGDGPGLVHAIGNRVGLAVQRNDPQGALALLDAQLAAARALGPAGSPAVVENLVRQMQVRPALGDVAGLQQLLVGLEAEARTAHDAIVLAECLAIRGTIAMGTGDVAGATALLDQAVAPARASGNGHALQLALGNLGLLAMQQGRLDAAEPMLREQLDVCRAGGIPDGLSAALGNLAILAQQRGDGEGALALLVEQEQVCRQVGDAQGLVLALANRGEVTARLGRLAEGLAALDEAAQVANQIGWVQMVPQIQQLAAQLRGGG